MALTAGNTIPLTTTLQAFIDMVYANRVNLPAASATITAVDALTIKFGWPAVGNGDNVIYFTPAARQLPSATIAV